MLLTLGAFAVALPFLAAALGVPDGRGGAGDAAPPIAMKKPKVDVVHGDRREDPYFWLRDKGTPEVTAYLEAENTYAEKMLAPTKELQATLYQEMRSHLKETDLSVPYRKGDYLYYTRTEEGKQYATRCRKKGSLDAPEEVTLDVNGMAEGHSFMGIGAYEVSDDAHLLAFSTDTTGFRQYTLQVKDLQSGEVGPEKFEKTTSAAWAADNRTLFFAVEDPAKRPYRVYRYRLGDKEPKLVYEEKDELFRVGVNRTRSGRFLVMSSQSHTTSESRLLAAGDPGGEWKVVAPRVHEREYEVADHGDQLFIRVNDTGRNFRVVTAPLADPSEKNWTEILPHRPEVMIEGIDLFANHWVAWELEGGLPQIQVTDLRSGASHRLAFPEPAYAAFPSSNEEWDTPRLRYSYQSLVTPSSIYDYDMDGKNSALLKQTEVPGGFDAANYVSERLIATAPDGVKVPISLVRRKGTPRDGSAPMLLGGYGSYGFALPVSFNSNRLTLLDRGFVVALAHIRGGGEMGKPWHDDGRMMKKMNTFTDFIACAEFLVAEKYTSRDRLVIEGGSAGSLLMGAVTNLRPDLFKAVVSHVPFVDVLNTMLDATLPLTVSEYEEWGNPNLPDEYAAMRKYCPYTNLAAKAYPSILVTTSLNDSQVMYWEPAKYVAKLRTLKTDSNPLLLVTNMGAGHGGASGRYDRLHEIARDYAFMLEQIGVAK